MLCCRPREAVPTAGLATRRINEAIGACVCVCVCVCVFVCARGGQFSFCQHLRRLAGALVDYAKGAFRSLLQARNLARNGSSLISTARRPLSDIPLMPGRPTTAAAAAARPCLRSLHNPGKASYATCARQGEPDAHRTFRVRDRGTRLPLPPILDPIVVAHKKRWKQKKVEPDASSLTPFQKKLLSTSFGNGPISTPLFHPFESVPWTMHRC